MRIADIRDRFCSYGWVLERSPPVTGGWVLSPPSWGQGKPLKAKSATYLNEEWRYRCSQRVAHAKDIQALLKLEKKAGGSDPEVQAWMDTGNRLLLVKLVGSVKIEPIDQGGLHQARIEGGDARGALTHEELLIELQIARDAMLNATLHSKIRRGAKPIIKVL